MPKPSREFAAPVPLISSAKGRKDRPQLDAMLKGVARKDFDIVASWSVDRLGRSLIDLVNVLQELYSTGVDLYLHQQVINTTTPAGKALFGTMGGPTHILQRSGQPRGATPLSTKS